MKDFIELWRHVFTRRLKPKYKRKGLPYNHNPVPKRNPLPAVAPPGPPTAKGNSQMKKKDRITELESQLKELREQSDRQAELLVKLTRELGEINRDIAHLLPEK